jgi:tRNA(Phe) wybutosine-synthesizing methylase Tyw3
MEDEQQKRKKLEQLIKDMEQDKLDRAIEILLLASNPDKPS